MLPHALDSILNQTYQNFELIVINDASNDQTSEILNKYAQKDKRIVVVENKSNQGIVSNRNMGLLLAKGKYLAWQDDDDVSEPSRLEEQVKFLEKHKDIVILGTQISLLGTRQTVYLWPTETDPQQAPIAFLIGRLPVIMATEMWRVDFIKKHNITFDQNVPLVEDFPIYDQVFKNGGKIMTLNKTLYQYRLHHSNGKEYYAKIIDIQKSVYQNRWKEFYPDTPYPDTYCKRLKHIKDNNHFFDKGLPNEMYAKHCKEEIYNPSYVYHTIVHENGYEEPILVSKNNLKFYSNELQRGGRLIKVKNNTIEVLWNGDAKSTIYPYTKD